MCGESSCTAKDLDLRVSRNTPPPPAGTRTYILVYMNSPDIRGTGNSFIGGGGERQGKCLTPRRRDTGRGRWFPDGLVSLSKRFMNLKALSVEEVMDDRPYLRVRGAAAAAAAESRPSARQTTTRVRGVRRCAPRPGLFRVRNEILLGNVRDSFPAPPNRHHPPTNTGAAERVSGRGGRGVAGRPTGFVYGRRRRRRRGLNS